MARPTRRNSLSSTPAVVHADTAETIGLVTADRPRLIEWAFPLRQTSVASVHEKSVRHGHLSTLHLWPARRPLAASRAALIASLLPDPGTEAARKELIERIGGTVQRDGAGKETVRDGILAWGREGDPDLAAFRGMIRAAHGGRAPKVMDPFAGGGAIPLEAMRMGCEAHASDINPVAWFIEKCTLEYPQRFAGVVRPLPDFVRGMPDLLADLARTRARRSGARVTKASPRSAGQVSLPGAEPETPPEGDLADHVRAWGAWVLREARKELADLYPVVDGQEPLAYLWARTVTCKRCGGTIPLLKTGWIARTARQRVRLVIHTGTHPNPVPGEPGDLWFSLEHGVPEVVGTDAQRKAHDSGLGRSTMSKAGVSCPHPGCASVMTGIDIRREAVGGHLGMVMTAVVVQTKDGKAYRPVSQHDVDAVARAEGALGLIEARIPLGFPGEQISHTGNQPGGGPTISLQPYGLTTWKAVYAPRQLALLGILIIHTRRLDRDQDQDGWKCAIAAYLAAAISKVADRGSSLCTWMNRLQIVGHTFARYALPMTWDFVEAAALSDGSGSYPGAVDWVSRYVEHGLAAGTGAPPPRVRLRSAISHDDTEAGTYDLVLTDPPYFSAIAYSDLMDYFHVWLRRTLSGLSPEFDAAFSSPLGPKWDHSRRDGELVSQKIRFDGDQSLADSAYEDGMTRAFEACRRALKPDGRMVVVFASKQADAWEALVNAVIRAGFAVTASWPIETEMANRMTTLNGAGLASSVWLVCRPRPEAARPGWEQDVLGEMRTVLPARLRNLWDQGIRGPDLVWAATGPAMEVYSRHPFVRRVTEAKARFGTADFLREARRMVVDFAVGRLLPTGDREATGSLDQVSSYYLLHRNDYGMGTAPAGACILYAMSCGVSQTELEGRYDLLVRSGGRTAVVAGDADDDGDDGATPAVGGDRVVLALKPWHRRTRPALGDAGDAGDAPPMIDLLHRMMQLWKAGRQGDCDTLIETNGLRGGNRFAQLVQAVIELAGQGTEERSLCESIASYLGRGGGRGATAPVVTRDGQQTFVPDLDMQGSPDTRG